MRSILVLCVCLWNGSALAQDAVLTSGFKECVAESVATGIPIMGCVADAHAQCTDLEPDATAEVACYIKAKEEWGSRLSALLESFSDKSVDDQQIIQIEAKYAVLRNLMNCDLRSELSRVGREPEQSDQLALVKCESLAMSAGLTEVLFRSGTITRPPN